MSLLNKLPDPLSGFFSSRRGPRHREAGIDSESAVRQKIVGVLEELIANPDSLQGYANELTDFFLEQQSINSMVKECSRSCQKLLLRVSLDSILSFLCVHSWYFYFLLKVHDIASRCKELDSHVQVSRRNQRCLETMVLRSFLETSHFNDLFRQLESILRDYFAVNLSSWGITGVTGSPNLRLDFTHVTFKEFDNLGDCKSHYYSVEI